MENLLNYVGGAVIAPFHLPHAVRKTLAERTTKSYLRNVSGASLMSDLSDALEPFLKDFEHVNPIFDKFAVKATNGEPIWTEQCFVSFILATFGGSQVMKPWNPRLWQCFCSAAFFPLTAPATSHPRSEGVAVDLEGFRKAFALLALEGVDFLGVKRQKVRWSRKEIDVVPRIARFITTSATTAFSSDKASPQTSEDVTADKISDAISFAQPVTYESYPYGPHVPEECYRDATYRISSAARNQPGYKPAAPGIRRGDLQALLHYAMLVSLQRRRWRNWRDTHQLHRRVHYSRLILTPDESTEAAEIAASLLADRFGDDGSISQARFEQYCSDCPAFVVLFFQVWVSIFSPTPRSHGTTSNSKPPMPVSVSNSLSLLNVAKILSVGQPDGLYLINELQFNVDLRDSSLTWEASEPSDETPAALKAVLTARSHDYAYFHVLLARGQDAETVPSNNGTGNKERLVAIFVAPQDPKMEIWSERDRERMPLEYVWHSSFVQLLPEVVRADAGPMSVVDDEKTPAGGELVLKVQGGENSNGADVPSVRIDLANRRLITLDPSNEKASLTLRWNSLQCYRMPGTAYPVTRAPRP